MKESKLQGKLIQHLVLGLPKAVIFDHNDRSTAGIPDLSITWGGYTTWLELKHLKGEEHILGDRSNQLSDLQLATLIRLETMSARAWAIAYRSGKHRKTVEVYRPTSLRRYGQNIRPNGNVYPGILPPIVVELFSHGAIQLEGFAHASIVQLIEHTHAFRTLAP